MNDEKEKIIPLIELSYNEVTLNKEQFDVIVSRLDAILTLIGSGSGTTPADVAALTDQLKTSETTLSQVVAQNQPAR